MKESKLEKMLRINLFWFLTNKPIWAFWLAYSALIAIVFGIFYTAMYILVLQWWVPIIIILALGIIWGSIAHERDSSTLE